MGNTWFWLFSRRPYSVLRHFLLYTLLSNGLAALGCFVGLSVLVLVPRFGPWLHRGLSEARLGVLSALGAWAAAAVLALAAAVLLADIVFSRRSRLARRMEIAVAIPSLSGILAMCLLLHFLVADVQPDWGIPDSVNIVPISLLLAALAIHGLYVVAAISRQGWVALRSKGTNAESP
jgi:hypothetical protein